MSRETVRARDAQWVPPCAECGDTPDSWTHHREADCKAPEDHCSGYVPATRASDDDEVQAMFDRRALLAVADAAAEYAGLWRNLIPLDEWTLPQWEALLHALEALEALP